MSLKISAASVFVRSMKKNLLQIMLRQKTSDKAILRACISTLKTGEWIMCRDLRAGDIEGFKATILSLRCVFLSVQPE